MARAPRERALHLAAVFGFCFWVLVGWVYLRPANVAADRTGWRQADTQTIAVNLTEPGASILFPRIAWGGDGPGYVETELQVYPAAIAILMRAFRPSEWARQLLS